MIDRGKSGIILHFNPPIPYLYIDELFWKLLKEKRWEDKFIKVKYMPCYI
jgi:hypothetical protein